ncbi:MAG: sulfatase [Planctomycetaceae bacterium]|nr:sulfatase [Planctomycetaceae bacterium]
MKSLTAFLFTLLVALPVRAGESRLNFVVILVDDLGWMDVSCQGSDYYRTPHVDRLAAEGIRFTNAYAACAVCSPTRAAVQTGRYPGRVGVTDWIRALFQRGGQGTPDRNPTEYVGGKNRKVLCPPNPFWMEHEELTIAEALGAVGYRSAYIGKWHLGDEAWYPPGQGYTVNKGGCDYGQPPSYFDPFNQPKHRHPMIRAGIPGLPGRQPGQYLTHREAEEAVELIEKWQNEPFFLQVGHYAVHTPIQAIAEVAAKYEREGKSAINAKYAAMVESFDDSTRDILAALERTGVADRTVIIFTSDNGGLDRNGSPTENAPLRSGKGSPYEGGIRVPFLVRWPGQVPAGTVSDEPVCSIDIFPTILEAAGVPLPTDRDIDGVSLVTHMKSAAKTPLDRDELIWHFPHYRHAPGPYSIIRQGDWKLLHYYEGIQELYNLSDDLSEAHDLSQEERQRVQQLEKRLMTRLKQMGAKLPVPNPDYESR